MGLRERTRKRAGEEADGEVGEEAADSVYPRGIWNQKGDSATSGDDSNDPDVIEARAFFNWYPEDCIVDEISRSPTPERGPPVDREKQHLQTPLRAQAVCNFCCCLVR